ncbi:MAG: hypothetical protein JO372_16170 [Solirubrobacterales bacterium]|nr:hypothetical protein [Solirubrobacterales bacterium]
MLLILGPKRLPEAGRAPAGTSASALSPDRPPRRHFRFSRWPA